MPLFYSKQWNGTPDNSSPRSQYISIRFWSLVPGLCSSVSVLRSPISGLRTPNSGLWFSVFQSSAVYGLGSTDSYRPWFSQFTRNFRPFSCFTSELWQLDGFMEKNKLLCCIEYNLKNVTYKYPPYINSKWNMFT